MKNVLISVFFLCSLYVCGQKAKTTYSSVHKIVLKPDSLKFQSSFNNYLVWERENALKQHNDSAALVYSLTMLDNLLKKTVIQSKTDVAMLHAIDNICPEITLTIDSLRSKDTLQFFEVFISFNAEKICDVLMSRQNSGLAFPSRNVSVTMYHGLASQIDILPRRSDNIAMDTAAYLNRIKNLIKTHEDKLKPDNITLRSYQVMEMQSQLLTATDFLSFRSSFIFFLFQQYNIYER
ncbi:MAG: hypothetical protein ABIQ40_04735 [Bacteroidia bacterium]